MYKELDEVKTARCLEVSDRQSAVGEVESYISNKKGENESLHQDNEETYALKGT